MTTPAQTLEIVEVPIAAIARPSHNLLVADAGFMTTLKTVEATVATLKITDAQSSQQAADLLSRLTTAGRTLEKTRADLKAPYLALGKQIDDAARAPQARIDAAKRSLSVLQTNWASEQRRIAEEAERARQAELRRLEAIQQQEADAAKKKADEIAEQLRLQKIENDKVIEAARVAGLPVVMVAEEENWDEAPEAVTVMKTETEKQIEAIKYAPAPVVAKAVGVKQMTWLIPTVIDINQVPDCFVKKEVNLAALRSTFCAGWKTGDALPVCAGVSFKAETTTVSTGKTSF